MSEVKSVSLLEKEIIGLRGLLETREKVNTKIIDITKKIMEKYGEVPELQGFIKLPEPDENGKQYYRIKIVDNAKSIMSGDTVWKSTGFNRYSVEDSLLKNEPK